MKMPSKTLPLSNTFLLKNYYKKQLLNRLTSDSDVDANKLIREALKAVDDKKAMACARFGRETIEK